MKLKIEYKYKYDGGGEPYWAYTYLDGEYVPTFGKSFEEAKDTLIKKVILMIKQKEAVVPPSEEIEIEVGEVVSANQS